MRRVAWYTAIVLATLTALVLVWQFRQAIVMFLLSLATAAAFRPFISFLEKRSVPRGLALILVYAFVIVIFAGLFIAASGRLVQDLERASNQLALNYEHIKRTWPENGTAFQRTIAEQLPPPEEFFATMTGEQGTQVLQAILGATANVFSFVGNLAIILILSLYWSADKVRFERLWLSIISVERRARARDIWREIEEGVGAYIRSEVIQSLLAGILLWAGYQVIGLNYPTLLSLNGALAWLIPWFGAILAVIPAGLVGLSLSPIQGILASVYTLLVLGIMEIFIEPRFFPRQSYSSVILVLVILALADAFGLIGLILSPLLAAAIQISLRYLFQPASVPQTSSQPARVEGETGILAAGNLSKLEGIQERLEKLKELLYEPEEQPSPEMVNLMNRLEQLVNKTRVYLEPEIKVVQDR